MPHSCQLISYIAPSAPATRRPARGDEQFLRPEIGFTPNWYHQKLGIDFAEKWHFNPAYRKQTILQMRTELRRRFPGTNIGQIGEPDSPLDVVTGTFGACTIAGIYGIPIQFALNNWPVTEHNYLSDRELEALEPPDLNTNRFFQNLMSQINRIQLEEGTVTGYINWQGILNNAQRLRGPQVFIDFFERPELVRHLFECVSTTMIGAAAQLHSRQLASGFDPGFFTVSNCLVNMISGDMYRQFLLPFDQKISRAFGCIGIHNCAWNANPYLTHYAKVPNVGYIDMGIDSDLERARKLFPNARRAIMYTPMDVANKSLREIEHDLVVIAAHYGPCDIVAADIESGTPDKRVLDFVKVCEGISRRMGS